MRFNAHMDSTPTATTCSEPQPHTLKLTPYTADTNTHQLAASSEENATEKAQSAVKDVTAKLRRMLRSIIKPQSGSAGSIRNIGKATLIYMVPISLTRLRQGPGVYTQGVQKPFHLPAIHPLALEDSRRVYEMHLERWSLSYILYTEGGKQHVEQKRRKSMPVFCKHKRLGGKNHSRKRQ